MTDEFSVRIQIPMFGKNKYPMIQFKDFDLDLERESSERRHIRWKEYQPEKRISAVDWHPTFLAISAYEYDRDGD